MSIHPIACNKYSDTYLTFNREDWKKLGSVVPLSLTHQEVEYLSGVNENLSLTEIIEIYIPLTRLINFYTYTHARNKSVLDCFLSNNTQKIPYLIGIAGSVAAGKSTCARVLKALLRNWPEQRHVEIIPTDGFLYPNKILTQKKIMNKKGFPESYNIQALIQFITQLKSGVSKIEVPIYSHIEYDIVSNKKMVINRPDIVILEGLNVLQSHADYPSQQHRVFVSDFLDFSIFVDADEALLRQWYIERFLKFRASTFLEPNAYFHHFTLLSEKEAVKVATNIWQEINGLNLKNNILPTRERAHLIITKGTHHHVNSIGLRK